MKGRVGGEGLIEEAGYLLCFLVFLLRDAEIRLIGFLGELDDINSSIVWSCHFRGFTIIYGHRHHNSFRVCFARRDNIVILVQLLVGQRVRGIKGDVLVEFSFQEASLEALVVAILDLVVVAAWEILKHLSPF